MADDSKLKPLYLGDLPTYQLKQFGLLLPEGGVYMPIPAQKHALKNHPDDYPRCLPFLSEVVETPSLCGQSPKHTETGFELVKEIDDQGIIVLVAVNIERNASGLYIATSAYLIDSNKVERRVRKKHLIYV